MERATIRREAPRRAPSWTTRTLVAQTARIPFDDAPFGAHAATPLQRAIIGLARACGFDNGAVRKYAAILVNALRAAPIDHEYRGLKMRFWPAHNTSTRHMLFTPNWTQAGEMRFVLDHLPAGGTFLDLGANVGFYLFAAAAHRPDATTIGFEPLPVHADRIRYNIAANGLAKTRVVQVALDDHEGTMPFDLKSQSLIISTGAAQDVVDIPTAPLLPLLRKEGVVRIDVLKADIEGMEDRVLMPFFREAPETLWPRAILTERSEGFWATDFMGWLRGHGYEMKLDAPRNAGLLRQTNTSRA